MDIGNDLQNAYTDGYNTAKVEIARAIFTELQAEISSAIESNYRVRSEHMNKYPIGYNAEFIATVHGKIKALRGIDDFIDELKKKYIGE